MGIIRENKCALSTTAVGQLATNQSPPFVPTSRKTHTTGPFNFFFPIFFETNSKNTSTIAVRTVLLVSMQPLLFMNQSKC